MKAWVLEDIGQFNLKETSKPEVSEGYVLVKVMAAGICGSDIQRVYENGAHKMPLVIGHEFSGIVANIGKNVSNKWINKRVGIFPLIPCKKCPSCMKKKYEMCTGYSYLGSRTDGGFSEYVLVPEWNLIKLPDNVSFEQAAMLEPMAVAVHSIRRLNISEKDTVAVCGLGTIGQLLIMFLKERGINNIYAIGKSDAQKNAVLSLGLTEKQYCNYNTTDVSQFIYEKTQNEGVSVYFDCVGKNDTASFAFDIVAAGGQVCIVGNPYSDMHFNRDSWWKLLRKQITITGTWNSSFLGEEDSDSLDDDWHFVINCLKADKIHPENIISHRLSIDELDKGFHIMKNKTESYTKVMMVI